MMIPSIGRNMTRLRFGLPRGVGPAIGIDGYASAEKLHRLWVHRSSLRGSPIAFSLSPGLGCNAVRCPDEVGRGAVCYRPTSFCLESRAGFPIEPARTGERLGNIPRPE